MKKFSETFVARGVIYALLPIAVAGCGHVVVIDDEGSGGAGNAASSSPSASSGAGGLASSSSGAGGLVSASSGTGGTGGTVGVNEICDNGIDDDADGHVDCADSECTTGFICVENVPFGWTGFATLFEGLPTQEPACPAAFSTSSPFKAYGTLITSPAVCSACSCGPPTGQTCDLPDSFKLSNKPCDQTAIFSGMLNVPANWNGTCYGMDYYPGGQGTCGGPCNVSISSPPATVFGGACNPQGGTATVPPNDWALLGKACGNAPLGGGCGAGKACQPRPEPPFLPGLCVAKAGDVACPAGSSFSQKHVYYDGIDDTRDCTSCTCSAPAGSACSATIIVHSDSAPNVCSTPIANIPTGGCSNLTGNPTVGARSASNITISGGTCSSSGGQPTGMATPVNPTTFCCIP